MKQRILYKNIWSKVSKFKSMIFLAGPRQVGKTTLAKIIAKDFNNSLYFNYDIIDNKKKLIDNPFFYEEVNRKDSSKPLIIFDEIHKYNDWKNYLKGVYDRDSENFIFLILGSGRLNIYKKGGDSLAGRYILFHIWPFTISELSYKNRDLKRFLSNVIDMEKIHTTNINITDWKKLSKFSGFPDPFIKADNDFYNIWSKNYKHQLLREDIQDIIQVKKADQISILLSLIPSRIGSPLSIDNLARDISVSFDSVKNWLTIFENFFLIFFVPPWSKKISRSISAQQKIYLMDYAGIESKGARFENMIALELYRAVNTWNDQGLGSFSLHYIRNKEKEEIDFLIAENNKPLFMIEAKLSDKIPSKEIYKFQKILNIPAIQLVNKNNIFKYYSNGDEKILVISAHQWLSKLP